MITGIAFLAYSVKDVPRARAFYRDTLGLRESDIASDHWIEYDLGGVTFGIGNGEPLGMTPGKSFGVSFEVDDVEREHARLLAAGVDIDEIKTSPVCRHAFARDPDGNVFAIHQVGAK